jgi:hypothetical protein
LESMIIEKPADGVAPPKLTVSPKQDTVTTPPGDEITKGPVATSLPSSSGSVVEVVSEIVVDVEEEDVVLVVEVELAGLVVDVELPALVEVVESVEFVELVEAVEFSMVVEFESAELVDVALPAGSVEVVETTVPSSTIVVEAAIGRSVTWEPMRLMAE